MLPSRSTSLQRIDRDGQKGHQIGYAVIAGNAHGATAKCERQFMDAIALVVKL